MTRPKTLKPEPWELDKSYWYHIRECTFYNSASDQKREFAEKEKAHTHPKAKAAILRGKRFISSVEHTWIWEMVWNHYIDWWVETRGEWTVEGFKYARNLRPNLFAWGGTFDGDIYAADHGSADMGWWNGHVDEMAVWVAAWERVGRNPIVIWECRFCGDIIENGGLDCYLVCPKEECIALAVMSGNYVISEEVEI
jgi:hypothetical protein